MKKKKAAQTPYTDELLKGILVDDPHKHRRKISPKGPFLLTPAMEEDEARTIVEARAKKIPSLLKHFGIPEDAPEKWERLAMALAVRHVPGFEARRKQGAPRKVTPKLLYDFYFCFIKARSELRKIQPEGKILDKQVIDRLLKDKEFTRRYSATPKRLGDLIIEARAARREAIMYYCRYFRHKPDNDFMMGDGPAWPSSSRFRSFRQPKIFPKK